VTTPSRRALLTETWLVLGVSLGASAIWSVLRIVERLTREVALSQQTSALNSSVTPDRPWLDLAYQLTGIVLGLVPAFLALHLLATRPGPPPAPTAGGEPTGAGEPSAYRLLGFDLTRPARDLLHGAALAAVVGLPGLGLYAAAKAIGINTTVAAANLAGAWWTIPVLILAAAQNAVLEEVVMVGYLLRRWTQAGWRPWVAIGVSALVRGGYHLYQGFGGFVGNAIMGVIFGWIYTRTKRVMPLVIAHTILDIVAFVGYALLKDHLAWL
jgi:membrane protease YdiL (CAAX protease family)